MKKKTIRIRVTKDHIDAARYMEENYGEHTTIKYDERCALALALKTQGFPDAEVAYHFIRLTKESKVATTEKIKDFIVYFDKLLKVKAFSFNLPLLPYE